uniref:Zinc finger family protein n=1 Tax=Rhizophora mucronata TaxID=61149 RepID=A0A2P2IUT8_RHIMU
MISNRNVANAVGGRTARACDSCIRKRARWYCAADDAFLCQACDSSVHSANQLARRHERVRLKIASIKPLDLVNSKKLFNSLPSWHKGFTRKPRTPRNSKPPGGSSVRNLAAPLVPEVGSDEISHEENEEDHLLYRVPIFDPYAAELCNSTSISNEAEVTTPAAAVIGDDDNNNNNSNGNESSKGLLLSAASNYGQVFGGDHLHGHPPSNMDLAEFAADVESLLGRGLENESFGMEGLGLTDCKEQEAMKRECNNSLASGKVKLEEIKEETAGEEDCHVETEIDDMAREPPFELSLFYGSSERCGGEELDEKVVTGERELKKKSEVHREDDDGGGGGARRRKRRKISLSLDYEAVIAAWASHGSPWTTGKRPKVDPDECWPDCMVRFLFLFGSILGLFAKSIRIIHTIGHQTAYFFIFHKLMNLCLVKI